MKISKDDILFTTSLVLAIWFTLTGIAWAYWIALIVAYPAGLISLILWNRVRKTDVKQKRYVLIPFILVIGLTLSLSMLTYLLIFD